VLEALQEVHGQVHPEEELDDDVEHDDEGVVGGREGRVEHRCNARVAHEEEDEDIEDGLPLAVGADDDPLFAGLLLFLVLGVGRYLGLTRRPVSAVVGGGRFEYFGRSPRSVERLLSPSFELFVDSRAVLFAGLLGRFSARGTFSGIGV